MKLILPLYDDQGFQSGHAELIVRLDDRGVIWLGDLPVGRKHKGWYQKPEYLAGVQDGGHGFA